jgi:hypothetical protein
LNCGELSVAFRASVRLKVSPPTFTISGTTSTVTVVEQAEPEQ